MVVSPKWVLSSEIEFEYGGTGAAREVEWYEENGEYETEIEKGRRGRRNQGVFPWAFCPASPFRRNSVSHWARRFSAYRKYPQAEARCRDTRSRNS